MAHARAGGPPPPARAGPRLEPPGGPALSRRCSRDLGHKDTPAMTQVAARSWTQVRSNRKTSIPEGLWLRCPGCSGMIYRKQMEANLHVCPECSHHFRIGAV